MRLSPTVQTGATLAAGFGLAGVLWLAFSGPFPLAEFCTRNRPTWVFGLFDRPRYTAVTGPVFLASMAGLTVLYLGALWLVRLVPGTLGRVPTLLLLAGLPILFVLVLFPGYPLLSNDIFKYVFDGRILAVYHENPFVKVPADYPDDRFYDLVYWKAVVNAHGPIWRILEAVSAQIGGERCTNAILAMKLWPTLAYLGSTAVVAMMLRSSGSSDPEQPHRPDRMIVGTLAYAWCPLVLLEALQNGHNDVVAALPLLLALWCVRSGGWRLAMVLVAVGFLVKPLAAVAGPVMLIAAWRAGPRARIEAMLGAVLAGIVVILAYVPFFEGIQTLQGLERGSIFSASPAELVMSGLQGAGWPQDQAMTAARLLASGTFGLLTLVTLLALWQRRVALGVALAAILFAYLLIGSQWFNPWYLLWLVPLAILVPDWRVQALALGFALLAPLTYLLQYDARLVVPLVFGPVALAAAVWRRSLGWSLGPAPTTGPLAGTTAASQAAGRG